MILICQAFLLPSLYHPSFFNIPFRVQLYKELNGFSLKNIYTHKGLWCGSIDSSVKIIIGIATLDNP